ncbi:DUF3219 domain-containing protein [Domibacillus antri]|uniref:DUF3219 domain-containing protein n=1 Tax=Domibacillus antri TaxID=1714264 RepID=A0A1Q8Q467_9BACI|nr:DUF3219 family protein [Domibacillus antri]OLN22092.1 DUF3219 domain-containing protein [Domibacillus antri]
MVKTVILNDTPIEVTDFQEETILDEKTGKAVPKIGFQFKVTSEAYHDITTLLYEMDFHVKVPEKKLDFPATIHAYSTSVTNLYEENAVGEFSLELIGREE